MAKSINLRLSAIQISIVNTTGIVLGLIFNILLGREFGISWELDSLFVSLLIFSFFGIFGGFLTSLLIPFFNELKAQDEKEGFKFADIVFKWSLLVGLVGYLVVLFFGPLIVKIFASGLGENGVELSNEILRILFIGYIFYNVITPGIEILKTAYLFLIPALVGLLSPLLNIAAIFFLVPEYGVKAIAISYLISNALQAFIIMVCLFIKTHWRPTFHIYHERLPELFRQSTKVGLSALIWGLWDIISRNIASYLGSGAIALLSYAEKILSVLRQVIINPSSRIFYPKISELITMARWNEVRDSLMKILRVNMSISIFISAGVIVFLEPLLGLLFAGSKFTGEDTTILFYLMAIELIQLIALSLETPLDIVMCSTKKTNLVLFISVAGVMLFYVFLKILSSLFGIYGLVLGASVTRIAVVLLYLYFLGRYIIRLEGGGFQLLVKNMLLATSLISIGLFVKTGIGSNIAILFLWGPVWMSVYLISSRYILKEEWEVVRGRGI